jgi:putative transport protein
MIEWFLAQVRDRPELAFFVTITLGYAIGRIRIGSFALGAVTGVLLAGVLVGQLGISLPAAVKQIFFLLFLFSIGYRTGPQFFRGLKKDGLAQAGVAAIFGCLALGLTYGAARILGYDAGTAVGLLAGAFTESATIGTGTDAISHLTMDEAVRTALANKIPVAFAVTYLVGVIAATWFLSQIGPRILGVDLAAECRAYEAAMAGGAGPADQFNAWRHFDVRTFEIRADSKTVGHTVENVESMFADVRIYVDRVHRGEVIETPRPDFVLRAGDRIAVAGRHEPLIEHAAAFGVEIAEPALVPGAADVVDVIVTNKRLDGLTIGELAGLPAARGVFLRGLSRSAMPLPIAAATVIERGDVLTLVGSPERTKGAIAAVGVPDRVTDATDMVFVGLGILFGAIVGIPAIRIGAMEIGISESVGVLLGGLVFGWLRSVRPVLGRIPTPTLWLFESLGLTGFIAVVGLSAGTDFVRGVKESGLSLVAAAVVVLLAAQYITLVVGKHFFRMHPGILLGVVAGAGTATPALAAIQEVAKSPVPTLGYGVSYAVGNVLLALWGSVMVLLIH